VNEERIVVAEVQNDYPNNPMLIKSVPLAYMQSIAMRRRRLLPYDSAHSAVLYFAKRILKVLAGVSPYIGLICALILFGLLWGLPDTLLEDVTDAPTRAAVNAAFVFVCALLLAAIGIAWLSGPLSTKWVSHSRVLYQRFFWPTSFVQLLSWSKTTICSFGKLPQVFDL
jgi:hypothetical protein